MALATVDQYGAPAYGPLCYDAARARAGGIEGIVLHTPENPGITLSSAIAIAKWQASSGNTSGGSYHGILACRDGADPALEASWVMVRSVPWDQAAGGLMSGRDPAIWQPDRHPWMRANMTAVAFADPNAWMHQIALSGPTAYYRDRGFPRGMLTTLARWLITLEGAYRYDALITEHAFWQTNRSDVTGRLADALFAEYQRLTAAPVDETAQLRAQVTALTARITKIRGHVQAGQADLAAAMAA